MNQETSVDRDHSQIGSSARRGSGDRQQLEDVLEQWAAAWSSGDVAKLLPLFTDDVVFEDVTFGAVSHGRSELREFATGVFEAFTDLKFELNSRFVAVDGKSAAMEWVWHGRQIKDLPDLPATNKPFEVRGATVVDFAGGKISRDSDYWDLATFMRQVRANK